MLWLTMSLAAALSAAATDTLTKRFFSDLKSFEMALIRLIYSAPILVIALLLLPRPDLDATFWLCIATALPLELTALLCYMEAIKVSPLSLTVPFLSFTPAFIILTGYLFLDEVLSASGILGIACIVAGSYVLNLTRAREQWIMPFLSIFRERGSWLMLLTSLIYAFTATLGKVGILHSSPHFFGVTYFLCLLLLMLLLFPWFSGVSARNLIARPLPGIATGTASAAMVFSHTLAISLVEAAYMISIKRTSLLFAVVFGAIVFHETHIRERLLGAAIMMAGVLLIALSSGY